VLLKRGRLLVWIVAGEGWRKGGKEDDDDEKTAEKDGGSEGKGPVKRTE
jgi:hypothetical protein